MKIKKIRKIDPTPNCLLIGKITYFPLKIEKYLGNIQIISLVCISKLIKNITTFPPNIFRILSLYRVKVGSGTGPFKEGVPDPVNHYSDPLIQMYSLPALIPWPRPHCPP